MRKWDFGKQITVTPLFHPRPLTRFQQQIPIKTNPGRIAPITHQNPCLAIFWQKTPIRGQRGQSRSAGLEIGWSGPGEFLHNAAITSLTDRRSRKQPARLGRPSCFQLPGLVFTNNSQPGIRWPSQPGPSQSGQNARDVFFGHRVEKEDEVSGQQRIDHFGVGDGEIGQGVVTAFVRE